MIQYHISDHCPVGFCKKIVKEPKVKLSFSGHTYKNLDESSFSSDIAESDWTNLEMSTDPNIAWEIMSSNFVKIVDKYCPIRQSTLFKAKPKYINYDIIPLTSDREYNFARAKSCQPGSARAEEYLKKAVKLRKDVNIKIRDAGPPGGGCDKYMEEC